MLAAGNARFMADERAHPHQDVHFRHRVAAKQTPFAIFFGCADSRVAAEIIFDQGLGDLFVVRTAGHVIDPSVLGSLEFGVGVLNCPLVVVLGHDSCGAVKAAEVAVRTGEVPGGFLRDIVERVTPSVLAASRGGRTPTIEQIEREHVERTCDLISERSTLIADRIRSGALGVVGASTTSPTARPRWSAPSATSAAGVIRLDGVHLHPVKSTAVRPVLHGDVEPWGLAGDRRWMVVDATGECVTAREEHRLLTVTADTAATDPGLATALRLSAPGLEPLDVDEPHGPALPVTVHGRGLEGVAAPDEAGAWFGAVLGRDDLRLVHVHSPRPLNPTHAGPGEATAFADAYPVTLASAASLRRLRDWVAETALERGEAPRAPLAVERFRPNLVVDGDLEPFEEDGWRRVRVGPVEFRVVKPVDRCVLTTIDPTTLERGHEPIRTLARHRKWDGATWFAVQLVPESRGVVRVGDEVTPDR